MRKILVIILLCIVCEEIIVAQTPSIGTAFDSWQKTHAQVMVQAVFNQNKYAPGDTAYFKVYFLTEQWTRVALRQVLQISLINSAGTELMSSNFGVKDGIGSSQFAIPDTLSGGFYHFAIYNDWMKNFNSSLFFYKEVEVAGKNKLAPVVRKSETVSFSPEGGTLIEGVTNNVIISAPGFIDRAGQLVTDKGDVVTTFFIDTSGLALVAFKPQSGFNYSASIGGKQYALPLIHQDGISVLLTPNNEAKPVKVILTAPENSAYKKGPLTIMLTMHGQLYFSATASLEAKDFVQLMIPQTDLPEGIAQLTVFNSSGKSVASRLFAVRSIDNVRVSIDIPSPKINTRENVAVGLSLKDGSGNLLGGEVIVSVVNEKLPGVDTVSNFDNHLRLTTDVRSIDPLISSEIAANPVSLDRWLITQIWKRFDWNRVLDPKRDSLYYKMLTVLSKRGEAFHLSTGLPAADSTLITVYLKNAGIGYETYTRGGKFQIMMLDFMGNDEMFYVADPRPSQKGDIRIRWSGDKTAFYPARLSRQLTEPDDYADYAAKKRRVDFSYHYKFSAAEAEDPNAELEDEFSGADLTINVQDYFIFPTMVEMIREIIPSLKTRVVGKRTVVRVNLSDPNIINKSEPLYVIDGTVTKDTEFFLSLIPADVLTVKIVYDVNKLRALGDMSKNGVVFVQTKRSNSSMPGKLTTTIPVAGLIKTAPFANDRSRIAPRIPDFRSTLYWNPSLKVPTSGGGFSFNTSDNTGSMIIKVSGITDSGKPFSGYKRIEVNFKK